MAIVYLRMKKRLDLAEPKEIVLKDIAFVSTNASMNDTLENMPIYRITKKDRNIVVIDSFLIVDHIIGLYPDLEIQVLGPPHTVIRIEKQKKAPPIFLASIVWILLFIGTAMTIMNFHYDVSMQEVQQKLHYLFTGEENPFPLWIQIPYSLGLGFGMLLFFNHWFNKRFNEEPSPLEVEIFKYQQSLDSFVGYFENAIDDPHNRR